MAKMQFKISFCKLCEVKMVICPKCGNNCCNGCYGKDIQGEDCDVCSLAYQYQEMYDVKNVWKERYKKLKGA